MPAARNLVNLGAGRRGVFATCLAAWSNTSSCARTRARQRRASPGIARPRLSELTAELDALAVDREQLETAWLEVCETLKR